MISINFLHKTDLARPPVSVKLHGITPRSSRLREKKDALGYDVKAKYSAVLTGVRVTNPRQNFNRYVNGFSVFISRWSRCLNLSFNMKILYSYTALK